MDMFTNRKNIYGFNRGLYSFCKFGQLLRMDTNSTEFQNIREDINDLRINKLNIDYSMKDQRSNVMQLIGNELKKRHPNVFNGKHGSKHLYFALHIIMVHHSMDRHYIKHRHSRRVLGAKKSSTSYRSTQIRIEADKSGPPDNRRSVAGNIQRAKGLIETGEILDLTDEQNIDSIIHNIKAVNPRPPSPTLVPRSTQRTMTLRPDSAAHSSVTSCPVPRVYEPSQYTGIGTSSSPIIIADVSDPTDHIPRVPSGEDATPIRKTEIYKFLSTCKPPMTHYLQRFVDFGCGTNMHLRFMSRWRPEQRHKTLGKILGCGQRDAGSASEMDIAVLENQFDTYFLED